MVNIPKIIGKFAVLLTIIVSAFHVGTASASQVAKQLEALHWYSEEYPPYNYADEKGVPTGMAVDILIAAFARIGVSSTREDIDIVPWNRSYKFIQRRPGTALFSMTYTPEREKLMKFVGPSVPSNISIIALKANNIVVRDVSDLAQLRIGAVRDDIGDQLVRQLALSEGAVTRKNSLKQLLYLLEAGRVDVVAYAVDVFYHSVRKSKLDAETFAEVLVLKKGQLGYAFHKSTPSEILAPLQDAIDALRAEGVIEKIIAKYRN